MSCTCMYVFDTVCWSMKYFVCLTLCVGECEGKDSVSEETRSGE